MGAPKVIRENIRFLTAEVDSQVNNLQRFFDNGSKTVGKRILDRSGYAYNLKMRIQESCLRNMACSKGTGDEDLTLRAMESIAADLDRIAELCRDCVHNAGYLTNKGYLKHRSYREMLEWVNRGIGQIVEAVQEGDTRQALKIGRIEQRLDQAYRKLRQHYTAQLKEGKHTEDLISALFVVHDVEQMGDALLRISEAIISANLGQPINTERYHSMRASVALLDAEEDLPELTIETIAETRSGSAIAGISKADQNDEGYVAIYKDGIKRKLKEERQGVESWHEIFPGLAPRILSYQKRGQSASLLIEHLAGLTFEQILLHESPKLLKETLGELSSTLQSIWRKTRVEKPVSAGFSAQISSRLQDVYTIHPEFQQDDSWICDLKVPAFDTLLKRAEKYEAGLEAPFSVYIHGDFNVDNIIYDPLEKRINFIDLHRSRYMDYVQDVSVFMVSIYRLQVLDPPLRRRIMEVDRDFYRFARKFARKRGDTTFDLRLALGLARSFFTSTRFILDKSLARAMFLRACYLIERIVEINPKQADSFRLPVEELFIA